MNSFAILYVFIFFRHNRYLKSSRKVDDFTGDWGCSLSWKWDHGHSTALYRGATAKYAFHFHDNPGAGQGVVMRWGLLCHSVKKKSEHLFENCLYLFHSIEAAIQHQVVKMTPKEYPLPSNKRLNIDTDLCMCCMQLTAANSDTFSTLNDNMIKS